jgi:hypothetical protein
MKALFPLGRVVATQGAAALLEQHHANPYEYLALHQGGVWGELDAHDKKVNADALRNGDRLMSVYRVAGERLWVITEADRSVTTLLLPEDY